MAYSATATNGFERSGAVDGSAPLLMEFVMDNNSAFGQGDLVALNDNSNYSATTSINKVVRATVAGTSSPYLGVLMETFTTTTNPSAAETYGKIEVNPNSLYRVTFDAHLDFTGDAGSTTTIVDTDLADTANYGIGGLIYCYEGNNKGESRIVDQYNDTTTLTVTKAFNVATGTTDKWVFLDGDASAYDGVAPGSYVEPDTTAYRNIDINACSGAATSGSAVCVAVHPEDLTMIIKIIAHRFNAAS